MIINSISLKTTSSQTTDIQVIVCKQSRILDINSVILYQCMFLVPTQWQCGTNVCLAQEGV